MKTPHGWGCGAVYDARSLHARLSDRQKLTANVARSFAWFSKVTETTPELPDGLAYQISVMGPTVCAAPDTCVPAASFIDTDETVGEATSVAQIAATTRRTAGTISKSSEIDRRTAREGYTLSNFIGK
jgi:hypothetical protein